MVPGGRCEGGVEQNLQSHKLTIKENYIPGDAMWVYCYAVINTVVTRKVRNNHYNIGVISTDNLRSERRNIESSQPAGELGTTSGFRDKVVE